MTSLVTNKHMRLFCSLQEGIAGLDRLFPTFQHCKANLLRGDKLFSVIGRPPVQQRERCFAGAVYRTVLANHAGLKCNRLVPSFGVHDAIPPGANQLRMGGIVPFGVAA